MAHHQPFGSYFANFALHIPREKSVPQDPWLTADFTRLSCEALIGVLASRYSGTPLCPQVERLDDIYSLGWRLLAFMALTSATLSIYFMTSYHLRNCMLNDITWKIITHIIVYFKK